MTSIDEKTKRRLHKLLALAEGGEGGERENAQRFLDRLLAKEGLTKESFLNQTRTQACAFKVRNPLQLRLLLQLINYFYPEWDQSYSRGTGSGGTIWAEIPLHVKVEIDFAFPLLWMQLEKEIDDLFTAFVHVNELFPDAPPLQDDEPLELSEEREEELSKIVKMTTLMDPTDLSLRLEEKSSAAT